MLKKGKSSWCAKEQHLSFGQLPSAYLESDPVFYLKTYIYMYLHYQILQEGLTRNLQAFARFLETASFSPAMKSGSSQIQRVGDNSINYHYQPPE